jgi:hypothetical protein
MKECGKTRNEMLFHRRNSQGTQTIKPKQMFVNWNLEESLQIAKCCCQATKRKLCFTLRAHLSLKIKHFK